jgi:hypothetical protein
MIGRKIFVLRGSQLENVEEFSVKIPDLEEIKYIALKKARKHGYVALVAMIRSYIRSSNFLKKTSKELHEKIKTRLSKNKHHLVNDSKDKQEVSKFLRGISEYKQKIRQIKHKIIEEEKMK